MSHTLKIEIQDGHNEAASPDANGQYPVAFIRKQLAASELGSTDLRYNPTTHVVQRTFDGGSTWVVSSGDDPRNQSNYPPLTGSDIRCRSAASVVRFITDTLNEMTYAGGLGAGATSIALGLVAALIELGPFDLLFALFLVVVDSMVTLTWAAIGSAMTTTVYDKLLCILYCRTDAKGQLNDLSFALVQSDVTSTIGGTAATVLNLILSIMGYGGINNAAAKAYDTDDCSGCGCTWTHTFDFTLDNQRWTVLHDASHAGGVWGPGGFSATDINWSRDVDIRSPVFASTVITSIAVHFTRTVGNYQTGAGIFNIIDQAGSLVAVSYPSSLGSSPQTWTGSVAMTQLGSFLSATRCTTSCALAGSVVISSIVVTGQGSNPF